MGVEVDLGMFGNVRPNSSPQKLKKAAPTNGFTEVRSVVSVVTSVKPAQKQEKL